MSLRLRLIAAALVLSILAGLGLALHRRWFNEGADSVRQEYREAEEAATTRAREINRERASLAQKVDADVLAKRRASEASSADIRTAADGLRIAVQNRSQPTAGANPTECAVERARADKLAGLLSESSRLVEEGAAIARDAVIRIDAMQERGNAK